MIEQNIKILLIELCKDLKELVFSLPVPDRTEYKREKLKSSLKELTKNLKEIESKDVPSMELTIARECILELEKKLHNMTAKYQNTLLVHEKLNTLKTVIGNSSDVNMINAEVLLERLAKMKSKTKADSERGITIGDIEAEVRVIRYANRKTG
jgi:hypothetical protein